MLNRPEISLPLHDYYTTIVQLICIQMLNFEIKISSFNFPFFLILWTSDEVDFMYFAFSGPWKASCTGSADIQLVIEFVLLHRANYYM